MSVGNIVVIPFSPEMEEAVINGVETEDGRRVYKKWTSRTKPYGKPGDYFPLRGHTFEIVNIFRAPLYEVAENYEKEGFRSKEEFIEFWNKTHPKKRYDPDQKVWVHEFELNTRVIIEYFPERAEGAEE